MKLRTLMRHAKEGAKSLGRNGWMTFASISAVTVALLLVGLFLTVMLNLNSIASQVENNVEVRVFIDRTATKEQQETLKNQLQQLSHVKSVTFVSKEQGLEDFIKSMGDDGDVFKSMKGKENPLPDAFVVKTDKPKETIDVAKAAKELNYVDEVNYGRDYVEKLFHVVDILRNIGLVLIVGLLFTSIFLIANTIKLTIVARRREIEIMKLVGATDAFVRWPYFIEGLMLGVLGSIIPFLLIAIGYHQVYDWFIGKNYQTYLFVKLIPYEKMTLYLGGLLVLLGAVIGVWGSLTSVRKFLKV
ncbi:permease-like cell division protein FtsX [Caenibacillus caldisaponilyticus]|uniref:permease-like cell division protein FtsX n=1 Tax=Caenibacillus caldisaponilyticus TaxID=1674942 RepID=UPI0009885145|nr:permease-like cell division protein FtsX [Caenibacillus caldisaponilyticus]